MLIKRDILKLWCCLGLIYTHFFFQLAKKRLEITDLAEVRKGKLGDSAQYYQFSREGDEVRAWLNEKLKIASDESYRVCKSNN